MAEQPTTDEVLVSIEKLRQAGDLDAAEKECRELLAREPREARGLFELGLILWKRGTKAEAVNAWQEAVAIAPTDSLTWHTLSAGLRDFGQLEEAEAAAQKAVAINEAAPPYWHNLAEILFARGKWQESSQAAQRMVKLDPFNPSGWATLGMAEYKLDHPGPSEKAYEQSVALAPDRWGIHVEFAHVLTKRGKTEQALRVLSNVINKNPFLLEAWVESGHAHAVQCQWNEAATAYRGAYELSPGHREIASSLFGALLRKGAPAEAEAVARQLASADATWADAWRMVGAALQAQGRTEEGIAALKQALKAETGADRHSRLLLGLQYHSAKPDELLQAHREWAKANVRQPTAPSLARRQRGANEKLRLGFVSSDFGRHPIGFLVLPALEQLDKSKCSVVCYSDGPGADDFTARFRAAADQWHDTVRLNDDDLTTLIRTDGIDVLFDLMGHTGRRMMVFAGRAAAVQVSWLGYVGTTGIPAMDYLLADRFHVRDGEEKWHVEKVLRMPNGYACYVPPPDAPNVGPLPALASGYVTFGCFNNPAKYSAAITDAWAKILSRVKNSRLLLKFRGLQEPVTAERLRKQFADRGIKAERVVLEGESPQQALLESYNRVDLALDTQPYSGGLTTCEALWMGVPVITFPGATFAGRHSVSHLTNAGFEQFIAKDLSGYVDMAVEWSGRTQELADVRSAMREQMRKSPLCDAPRFAKDFLEVISQASVRAT